MSDGIMISSCKRRKIEGDESPIPESTTQDVLNQELNKIKNSKTGNSVDLLLIQQILLDIHDARKTLDDVNELVTVDKENKNIAQKVSATTDKLQKVHNYLLEAFDGPLEVVLHKAQYGEKSFDLDKLPDFVIGKILGYLDFQDKKILREVAPRLAEVVMLEDSSLRQWTIHVDQSNQDDVTRHLERAKSKGITALAKFQLHLEAKSYHIEKLHVVKTWQEHIYGLDAYLDPFLATLHLPNLEHATLGCGALLFRDVRKDPEVFQQVMRACGSKLTRLDLLHLKDSMLAPPASTESGDALQPLTKLSTLDLSFFSPDCRPNMMILNICRNITKLDIGESRGVDKLSEENLQLPALKHLGVRGAEGFVFLSANASHIESLHVRKNIFTFNSYDFEFEGDYVHIPTSLPKLQTFIYLEPEVPIFEEVLEASENTLERLVMRLPESATHDDYGPMTKLKTLVLVDRSGEQEIEAIQNILSERAPSLEHMAIYNLKFDCTLDAFAVCDELPHLKDLNMYVGEETTMEPFAKFEKKLKEQFPSAQVNLRRESFEEFLDHFTKAHCGGVTNCKLNW